MFYRSIIALGRDWDNFIQITFSTLSCKQINRNQRMTTEEDKINYNIDNPITKIKEENKQKIVHDLYVAFVVMSNFS